MLLLGLTGGIATGKSYAARLFRAFGVPVFDSDAAVHALYAPRGRAVAPVLASFPGCGDPGGGIDRARLGAVVLGDAGALRRLEGIVHRLVRAEQRAFLERCGREGRRLVVLDVPLLFETDGHRRVDRVAVASAPARLQRERALRRPGMTPAKLASILAKQVPDAVKRRRADFVIPGGRDRGAAPEAVARVVRAVAGLPGGAWPARWLEP